VFADSRSTERTVSSKTWCGIASLIETGSLAGFQKKDGGTVTLDIVPPFFFEGSLFCLSQKFVFDLGR
jgi:hypothetical protein